MSLISTTRTFTWQRRTLRSHGLLTCVVSSYTSAISTMSRLPTFSWGLTNRLIRVDTMPLAIWDTRSFSVSMRIRSSERRRATLMLDAYASKLVEKAVLVSGDGDYKKVVSHLIGIGKFERLLLPSHENASSLYKKLPEAFKAYLDAPDVRKKIERKQ